MTADNDHRLAPLALPAGLSEHIAGYAWSRDGVGESGGEVYRLHGKPGARDLYLKYGQGTIAGEIADEMHKLRWLAGYLPVPTIRHFIGTPNESWLLMTALAGHSAYQVLQTNPRKRLALVDALADFLRRFHAIAVDECPFNADHNHRLAHARKRIDAGLVDEDDFDEAREGWTAEQVWQALQGLLPFPADAVVTHGDFSLDNLLMHDGEVIGCIDVGRAGVADRYQDLAILWNCLGEFDASLQERLLTRYGITTVDRRKLDFHLLLDELF